ncbi:MAG: cysteine desulfurase [Desulfurococcales archaeon]|nr:cysteine desulfurase [Desulfurococcales archaeon]
MIDCERVRKDFPELGSGLVYLDSAASTLKPKPVVDSMKEFALRRYSNVHRGTYKLAVEATRIYEEAHRVIAEFIGAKRWEEIVFTYNTTHAINLVAWTLVYNGVLKRGDEILVTEAEHHSNLLPWAAAARAVGARLRILPVDPQGIPVWEDIDEYITDRTRVVAFHLASNVTGAKAPVEEVSRAARSRGAIIVVDGAQGVPHFPIDVNSMNIDFLAFSGHKMLGPTGIGVLWGRLELLEDLEPPWQGGGQIRDVRVVGDTVAVDWDEPPWKFEPGTPPIVEAVGLTEAVRYLEKLGMSNVESHESELVRELYEWLGEIRGVKPVGPPPSQHPRTGVVSFTLEGLTPDAVSVYLASRGIAVRAGLHCAHPLHYALGLYEGTIRASLYIYNCSRDAEALVSSVESLVKLIGKTG